MLNNGLYLVPDARITFRNFRGEERQYNDKGSRNFHIVLTPEQAEECLAIGFNVKERPSRDVDAPPQLLLPVAVSYKNRPPKLVLISDGVKTLLNEDTVGELDYADCSKIDLSIRPYPWTMTNGTSGVKAYLNSGYFTLASDGFSEQYADIPTVGRAPDDSDDALPF